MTVSVATGVLSGGVSIRPFNTRLDVALAAETLVIGGPSPTPDVIYQKVYDSSAGFVYYTDSVVNPTPLDTATTPNHTNALVGGTHSVIARF